MHSTFDSNHEQADARSPDLTLHSDSVERTMAIAAAIGKLCVAGDVLRLEGELGAGKTQFVRGLAKGMGLPSAAVSSPTFVLMQEYADEIHPEGLVLVHIDAYRLDGEPDASDAQNASGGLEAIGLDDEMLEDAVLAVEWPSRLAGLKVVNGLDVNLRHVAATEQTAKNTAEKATENATENAITISEDRLIEIQVRGTWRERCAKLRLDELD